MKINDLILRTVVQFVVFIVLTIAIYLFFAGHYTPGGGFVAGLVLASAVVMLYISFDTDTVRKGLPLDFKIVAAIGVTLALLSGILPMLFGQPFLKMSSMNIQFPLIGEKTLATVMIFELGVALTVVGVVMTIILSISEGSDD
ncbi:Na(+)/H(+) antiporter subunit B [Kurthia sibirica]|uniref:Na(+)/H(+) antiporter subunit B n=1 Tax=Kurthia sibirica TaxID=202750 RepID=A0A2U3AQ97_9BACL|nr:Na(+)/H(+) antiporter subunit B [Kurthia sibirica]PWI26694.1 Na(+)/H(+) antiporter subunit B [Kurthia sibirica]GEK32963.1 putative antiporter subunit mnhB2 [Kurthia sibirica]